MALESKKSIVPQEIILNGDPTVEFFTIVDKNGAKVMTITGDGKVAFFGATATGKQAAITAAVVAPGSFTHQAPGADDYAIQAPVQNSGFGFATANEMNSTLKVIQNLLVRVAELESRLEAAGTVTAN